MRIRETNRIAAERGHSVRAVVVCNRGAGEPLILTLTLFLPVDFEYELSPKNRRQRLNPDSLSTH